MSSDRDQRVLVSACLLGSACRYDGRHNRDLALERELDAQALQAVPFCPEQHAGLGTPRPAAWIGAQGAAAVLDGREQVLDEHGQEVTGAFLAGARGALELCLQHGIVRALLKERSPSCGVTHTHAAGRLVEGPGVTTELLRQNGIAVEGREGRRD